jgi:hypothetical protein
MDTERDQRSFGYSRAGTTPATLASTRYRYGAGQSGKALA